MLLLRCLVTDAAKTAATRLGLALQSAASRHAEGAGAPEYQHGCIIGGMGTYPLSEDIPLGPSKQELWSSPCPSQDQ